MLGLAIAVAVVFFLAVTGLSRAYHAQRAELGNRWFLRGVADLKARNYDAAATEFRTALLYSRDEYSYQLNLAEALIGLGRTGQASAYLLNLWEREPEDGLVNLELARIAMQQGHTPEAVRYYHDAEYAVWPASEEAKRDEARLELVELLLHNRERAQAQAELIALSANASTDAEEEQRIGALFMRAEDYEHALAAYRVSLRSERNNAAAMSGAGQAAFELGRYAVAQRYLQEAAIANPNDTKSAEELNTANMVLDMDPFGRKVSSAVRDRLVVKAYAIAGKRLACASAKTAEELQNLNDEWTHAKARVNEGALRRDADLAESTMDLVFRVERETSVACGMPAGEDLALLLIAKLHEGS
jgi:tetratricopeptide (TPR) repeat protein